MRTSSRSAALLGVTVLLTTLTHATRAQSPEALERQRGVASAVEGHFAAASAGGEIYLLTDKPLYHPGEAVWFRAWEVASRSFTASTDEHGVTFQLIDPRGAKVLEKRVLNRNGVAANDFALPPTLPGGTYTLRAQSDRGGREERTFTVSTYEVPRLKKSVEFTRASYTPGDTVTAMIAVERATGEPLANTRVTATVTLNNAPLGQFGVQLDARGNGMVRFQLPAGMPSNNVLLTLTADAGGIPETMQKRVPVVLDRITAQLFPEGGDLVAGLPSRVYLMARDDQGEPAEVEGQVLDTQKNEVLGTFKSLHDGMARFSLTPQPGRSYAVKITRPAVATTFALPAPKTGGCVLRPDDDFSSKNASVRLNVACSDATKLVAAATLRDKLLASAPLDAPAGQAAASVSLPLPAEAVGAVRLTLFDANKNPLAERLVYRGLGHELRVQISADKKEYTPRDKVTLTVKTTDGSGKPVPADLALSVVDDSVLRFADSKTANILSDLYLSPEMPGQKIHEPNFYFSSDPKAAEALDLLLSTQGWRRFAWKWVQR